MKKILLTVAIAVAAAGAASAQQGQMAAGINLGVAPCIESGETPTNFQLGAKFQYGITDDIRGEFDLEYGFKSKETSVFDMTVNVHYLINVADNFKVYPLVGLGWASVKLHMPSAYKDALSEYEDLLDEYGDLFGDYGYGDYIDDEYDNIRKASKSESVSRFVFNIGVGGEYDITENLALNLEVKYQYMKDFNRMPITLGIAYKF